MAISTKGISPMDLSSGIKSKNDLKSKAEKGAADSFSSLINMSSDNFKDENGNISDISNKENDSVKVSDKLDAKKKTDNSYADKTDTENKRNTDNDINSRDGKQINDVNGNDDVENVSENKNVTNDTNTEKINTYGKISNIDAEEKIESLAEQLADLIAQITDILKNMLGIGDEELEENLSVLDMNFTDLLETENVSGFVLYAEGATEVDILIDEQLATLINDTVEKINDIIDSFEAFDLNAETVAFEQNEDVQTIDIKAILDKTDEIIKGEDLIEENTKTDEEVAISKDGGLREDSSFIRENADNNISGGFNVADLGQTGASNSKNSSSDNFGSSNESVVNNLNNAINNAAQEVVNETSEFTESISQADIIRQVIDEIKTNVTNEVTSLEMRLNPESLGRVQITVSSRNGVMQAQIVAETEAAKNAIEENIAALREILNNQDLKVEDVEVTIASYGFFEGQEQDMPDDNSNGQKTKKGIAINSEADSSVNQDDEELLEEEMMKAQGNSVSYSI